MDHIFSSISYFHLVKINRSWSKKKVKIGSVKILAVEFHPFYKQKEICRKINGTGEHCWKCDDPASERWTLSVLMCGSKLLIVRRVYPRGRKSGEKPGNKKGKHMAEKLKQTFTKGVGYAKTNWKGDIGDKTV